ncbi:hypothetical protein JHK87_040245 [Glycine soja]|nr:hypothetical protein JHK87_040245 [Glycine soja]
MFGAFLFILRLNKYCLLCVSIWLMDGIMQLYVLSCCCSMLSMYEFGNWLCILSWWAHVKSQLSCIYGGG